MAVALLAVACNDKGKDNEPKYQAKEYDIDAVPTTNDPWDWTYVSLANGAVTNADGAWDIAISRYKYAEVAIKTNSGTSGSRQGGVVKNGVVVADTEQPISYMDTSSGRPTVGEKNISWSGVEAIDFGFAEMPPKYTLLPASTFRSADGAHYYIVQFTAYLDDNDNPGYITMMVAETSPESVLGK